MTTAIIPVLTALPAHAWGNGNGPGWFVLFPFLWILLIGFSSSSVAACSGVTGCRAIP